jgi:hypothetical protein
MTEYTFDFKHTLMSLKLFIKTRHIFYLKIILLQLKQIKRNEKTY